MAKNCVNCGAQLDDEATYCFQCKKNPDVVQSDEEKKDELVQEKKKDYKKTITGIIIAVLVVAIGFFVFSCARNNPKSVVLRSLKAEQKLDYKGYLKLSYAAHFDKDKTYAEYKADAKKENDELKENGKLEEIKSDRRNIKYKVEKVEKFDKDDLESLKDEYSSNYKDTDKITDAAKVKVKATEDGKDWTFTMLTVKCKGKWYVTNTLFL